MSSAQRGGFLETKHWVRITQASSELAELPIQLQDHPSPTIDGICEAVAQWRAGSARFSSPRAPGLVVIDAVKRVRAASGPLPDWVELGRRLKELAASTGSHLVLVSSLSAAIEERAEHRPMLQDLRPRGLDRVASAICLLYRDEVYSQDRCAPEDRGVAELIIGKNDDGPTGMVRLRFRNHLARFDVLETE